jgi:acyl-ACP thioesterase
MERRREPFPVRSYDADAFGLLAAPALAGYLQDIAGRHAEALGVGMEALRALGQAWVLGRQRIEILRPIAEGELLEIETWPSGANRLLALRDFAVRGRGGEEVARAVTAWFVMDLATRRTLRPDRVLDPRLHPAQEHALPPPESKLPELATPQVEKRFEVRYQDIDRVMHVANSRYLAWALEAVPREVWEERRLASLEAHYLAECRLGSAVLSRSAPAGDGAFLHAVVREEDGRELARLRTAWVPRGSVAVSPSPVHHAATGGRE